MFGLGTREQIEIHGVATQIQIRAHTTGHVGPQGGHVDTSEVMTFRLATSPVDGSPPASPVSVELVARRFRGEIGENDQVRVTGIWKDSGRYLRALRVDNLSAQRSVKGSRWG
jgi:hypothetical protein